MSANDEPPDVAPDAEDDDERAAAFRAAGRTTRTARAAPPTGVRRVHVTVVDGPDRGLAAAATGARVVVGTQDGCELRLSDPTVSRFHCELFFGDGRLQVRDLGSRNGVIYRGMPILHALVPGGAVLSLGNTRLRVDLGDTELAVARSDGERFGRLVGRSPAMRAAFALLERAAASDVNVLIEGETGTGKEGAAEGIHLGGARAARPFIVVDCGAVPPDLLESELFGHERGAFTGAAQTRKGAFEIAAGGTIFLDEIGELALDLQPKLLRVLEKREIKRVGSSHYFPVDVRVIAATNRNLREGVNRGKFRADLFYRVAVLRVTLPPLRERLEDLPVIAGEILAQLAAPGDDTGFLLEEAFLDSLVEHDWPGNARELRNHLERCLALRAAAPLEAGDGPPARRPTDASVPFKDARERAIAEFERAYLTDALARSDGRVATAARAAQLDRMYFYRLLWKHGLKRRGGEDDDW
jgi:DNA-binding NtrC family response regulator